MPRLWRSRASSRHREAEKRQLLLFLPRLDDVFDLYTKMVLGMAAVFQMPTIVFFLAKVGLVTWRLLWRSFRYAFLLIFIAAAPSDPPNKTCPLPTT